MGTGEEPAGTNPSDISDGLHATAAAWVLHLSAGNRVDPDSDAVGLVRDTIDWLRGHPEELARLLGEDVVPVTLGWSNPDTGPTDLRLYALDQGPAPRWVQPHARVAEVPLVERGGTEGDRYVVIRTGGRA
jgi:hypothetical protein